MRIEVLFTRIPIRFHRVPGQQGNPSLGIINIGGGGGLHFRGLEDTTGLVFGPSVNGGGFTMGGGVLIVKAR